MSSKNDVPMALNGWHRGERAMHAKLGHEGKPEIMDDYQVIRAQIYGEMANVYANVIPFVPVVTLDDRGRPWSSVLVGEKAERGFVRNSKFNSLQFKAKLWPGDPFFENLEKSSRAGKKILVAGVGVDYLKTRRRLKFAGNVERYAREGYLLDMTVGLNQVLWNCPKYIPTSNLQPYLTTHPRIVYDRRALSPDERLPDDIISFILNATTTFFGTSYEAPPEESEKFPSHLGLNERSGNRGFIRVKPSDGRTLVLPDYSGNRFMTTLGNIEATPVASLTFVSWTTGAILYITGSAKNHTLPDSHAIMPFQNLLTTIYVTGYIFVEDAFPMRQAPPTASDPGENSSVYSPPIRYLAEEAKERGLVLLEDAGESKVEAVLRKVELHSNDIATFTWEASKELEIEPGQAIIMDFTSHLGPQGYQHMSNDKPSKVNDDRLRTWTVSSASNGSKVFSLTVREKVGGAVTGSLFSIVRRILQGRPELLKEKPVVVRDPRNVAGPIKARVVGVTGDFSLPEPEVIRDVGPPRVKLLWIAGGIGFTPFLSMLNGLAMNMTKKAVYDIHFVLATREPEVLVPLVVSAVSSIFVSKEGVGDRILLDVFSRKPIPDVEPSVKDRTFLQLRRHEGRLGSSYNAAELFDGETNVQDRTAYLCGPPEFERAVLALLKHVGLENVRTEGFAY